MVQQLSIKRTDIVLDPFCGVGTTCLSCKELSIPSIGFDISPLFVFISTVKTRNYDAEKLRKTRDFLFALKFERPEIRLTGFLRNLFPKPVLEDLLFFREALGRIDDEQLRDFFVLALMAAAEKSSYMVRDGAVVKVVKNKPRIPSFRKAFRRAVNVMITDVERRPLPEVDLVIRLGDAREMDFVDDESVDAVITSPPYLNKIEYTRCYWPEYELFFPHIEHKSLRSYVGIRPEEVDYSRYTGDLPVSAFLYFEDMSKVLQQMHRVLKDGGRAVMVVGGGVYPDRVIETDVALAEVAEKTGFEVERIVAVNKRVAAVDRVRKIGVSRESIISLAK